MPSSRTLLRLAEQAEADAVKLERSAAKAREQAAQFRAMAESAGTDEVLTDLETPVNTSSNTMNDSQRVAISRSKRRKGDKISAAINKANLSKNDIAKRLGVTAAALSRWISGDRRIPKTRAEEIQAATKGHVQVSDWPNLLTDDA